MSRTTAPQLPGADAGKNPDDVSSHDMEHTPDGTIGHDSGFEHNSHSLNQSSSSQDDDTAESSQRRRVVVKSIPNPEGGLLGADFTQGDLIQFKARLDRHIEEFNDALDVESDEDPICIMIPWTDKVKIIFMPASEETGNHVINMINTSVRLTSHKIIAGWNMDLPMAATVSISSSPSQRGIPRWSSRIPRGHSSPQQMEARWQGDRLSRRDQ